MTETDYSEENLDEFMLRASKVLSQENHPDTSLIIDSLKEHLNSIFHDKPEMENFFKTLNYIIFSQEESIPETIVNPQPFQLYPLVFAFNPKSSYFYMDYFLTSLQISASSDKNINEFPFLSAIFAEVIKAFFSNDNNKFLINKKMILELNKKNKLYEKILNFCNNNIKSNEKTKQSFGCLLLTEFVEKCDLIKEENNIENIFKLLSEYLEDHWFECKLDLLNCALSLIFTVGKKFKPYANTCLFKILDFFTDEDWMKRKLAVNIVYTLVFYCKEEILNVKDNIVDFLNVLKDDPVDKVKEICLQTLNFIEECDPNNEKNENDSKDNNKGLDNNSNLYNNNDNSISKERTISVKQNKNRDVDKKLDKVKNKKNIVKKNIKKEEEKIEKNLNDDIINFKDNYPDEIEERKNDSKEIGVEKANIINIQNDINNEENIVENDDNNKKKENNEENMETLQIKIKNKELKEKYGNNLNNILDQIKKIQETQNILNSYLENVRYTIDQHYTELDSRLKILEDEAPKKNYNY